MFRSRPVYFFTVVLLVAIDGLGCHVLATLNFTLGTLDTPFQCNVEGNLWCAGNASTSSGETLHLIPDERNQSQEFYFNTMGMALFSSPVDMVDAKGRWMSFSTHFIFEIESRFLGFPGDGMAFVMLSEQVEGSPGGSFGIYNKHGWQVVQTLAIEFDTFQNTEIDDRSRNHVGVDLETIRSKVSRDAQEVDIDLAGDRTINAWIDYHAVSELLEVRIDLHGTKPKESFLTYPLALSDVFPESGTVYVGFSGSNGYYTCHNFYSIQDWNFQVFPENRSILYLVEIIGGIFILIVIIVVLICGRLHRRSLYTPLLPGDVEREELSCRRFSYKELVVATNHFDQSQKLGEGGFGSVYRGVLGGRSKSDSGSRQWVAVKKLKENSSQGKNEFQAELSIISKLQHRHIVRLLGWCGEKQELMLVYDLMPNGGLDKALFNSKLDPVLSWKQRPNVGYRADG
ncbi:hypothetical protein Mapa_005198 [Marchantia paleacea]|nr:hypothetical protein Mapa_005198 [Marchantia paleacea]